MNRDITPQRLLMLVAGALTVWALLCFVVHGPAILAYIGLQTVTTGAFVWDMRRIEKRSLREKAVNVTATPHGQSSVDGLAA
ncbi:MAG: hypothetical protein VB858_01100 [Planctomycetaceae bacterium]